MNWELEKNYISSPALARTKREEERDLNEVGRRAKKRLSDMIEFKSKTGFFFASIEFCQSNDKKTVFAMLRCLFSCVLLL